MFVYFFIRYRSRETCQKRVLLILVEIWNKIHSFRISWGTLFVYQNKHKHSS